MSLCLVADIGGTNGRFCLFDGKDFSELQSFRCAEFDTFESLLNHYIDGLSGDRPTQAVIAIATHVSEDNVEYTNLSWSFSVKDVAQKLNFDYLKIINDFTAVSLAVPVLKDEQLVKVFGSEQDSDSQSAKAIIGPGTGLGVSGLFHSGDSWLPIQGQGGHVVYGPNNEFEIELFKYIAGEYGYVSAENLLSGRGLQLLYQAAAYVYGAEAQAYSPANIVSFALDESDENCLTAVDSFCGILGSVASDLVLTLGARGGVYIGGGVVNHMLDYFVANKNFQNRFQRKGCMTPYMEGIPAYVICDTMIGLVGSVQSRLPQYDSLGITVTR